MPYRVTYLPTKGDRVEVRVYDNITPLNCPGRVAVAMCKADGLCKCAERGYIDRDVPVCAEYYKAATQQVVDEAIGKIAS